MEGYVCVYVIKIRAHSSFFFREEGSKVLVHCKMGISRSASVVIAYVMKANNWNLKKALRFVKDKRQSIRPNENFLRQLEVYQGILNAR